MSESRVVQGVSVPAFFYGTAWKEERTEALTAAALACGFRAIDTANQRKHYFEAGVGAAVATCGIARSSLFLQTKYTYVRGQDQRLPYDPSATLSEQVRQSCERSLEHLRVTYLDSLVLHGPWSDRGWSAQDEEVWAAMERLRDHGLVRLLGVSNTSREQLEALCDRARILPAFVQNRCYARTQWDRSVRECCRERGVVYQGFSLLTANRKELESAAFRAVAQRLGATVEQVTFALARTPGMVPLTGSSSAEHLREDLASASLVLTAEEVTRLEGVSGGARA